MAMLNNQRVSYLHPFILFIPMTLLRILDNSSTTWGSEFRISSRTGPEGFLSEKRVNPDGSAVDGPAKSCTTWDAWKPINWFINPINYRYITYKP